MNILFLCSSIPYPPYRGYQLRCYNILKKLSENHQIYLLSFMRNKSEEKNLQHLRKYCVKTIGIVGANTNFKAIIKNLFSLNPFHISTHRDAKFKEAFDSMLNQYPIDLIYCNFLYFVQYLNEKNRRNYTAVLDQHNLDRDMWHKISKKHSSWLYRIYGYYNFLRTKSYENRNYRKFDLCFSVSEEDLKGSQAIPRSPICVLAPNGVDTQFFKSTDQNLVVKNSLIFTSSNADRNIEAIKYFYFDIFPIVKKHKPETKFFIVGSIDRYRLNFIGDRKDIVITGRVRDTRPYFNRAVVYIAPFKLGGGSKLKILEAMAMKKAIVSTTVGCQGIDIKNEESVLITNQPEDFAKNIIRLFKDETLRNYIGENARVVVESKYDWGIIVDKIEDSINKIVALKGRSYDETDHSIL